MCAIQEERRQYLRYEVRFPAMVTHGTGELSCPMHTRDISASGALFHTDRCYPEGARVKVEITLENKTVEQLTGQKSCIKVIGTIVRSDADGMAVSFAEHRIIPLQALRDN
jgi:hypothetical protein